MNEIAFCRGEMANLLQPRRARHALLRPHAKDGKSGKGGGGRKRTLQDDARASESASAKAAAKVKAAGKAKSAPNAPPKGWDASWCKQIGDKEACALPSASAPKLTASSRTVARSRSLVSMGKPLTEILLLCRRRLWMVPAPIPIGGPLLTLPY